MVLGLGLYTATIAKRTFDERVNNIGNHKTQLTNIAAHTYAQVAGGNSSAASILKALESGIAGVEGQERYPTDQLKQWEDLEQQLLRQTAEDIKSDFSTFA